MKSFARVAVAGVASIALFKLFTAAVIPLLGMTLSLVMLAVKLALIGAVLYFVYSLLRPRPDQGRASGDVDIEEEIEIVVEDTGKAAGE